MGKQRNKPRHRAPAAVKDDALLEHVERATQKTSRQPPRDAGHHIWHSTVTMVNSMGAMPSYDRANIHRLDDWCRSCLMKEPYLTGFINKIVAAQANRGWSLVGGKRTVNLTAQMMHRFDPTTIRLPDGRVVIDEFRSAGWRKAQKRKILSYLTRNAGAYTEIQYRLEPRFTANGWSVSQVTNLYNMDTRKVEFTANALYPIRYDGSDPWPAASYYHLVASPLDTQEYYDCGMSPLFRCIRLAQLMVNIGDWEIGTLADDFVDVILLLNGATDEEFNAAMKARSLVQVNGNKAKRGAVIASTDPSMPLTAEVLRLREKPASLDDFTSRLYMLLQGYAVNLGYGLGHFMESPFGALLGRSGNEIDAAQRTTAEAGGNDYHLEDQAAMNQYVMPANIAFLYDEQDIDERSNAEITEIRARTIEGLFLAQRLAEDYKGKEIQSFARGRGNNLGTPEQFRQLMVDWGIVPPEWTEGAEDINVTDVEQVRMQQKILSMPEVHRFILGVESGEYRDDAITRYHYNPEKDVHGWEVVFPSVAALLDAQSRTFVPAKATERVTQKEMNQARQKLLEANADAKAIAGVIA